jgi:hypothetical protein
MALITHHRIPVLRTAAPVATILCLLATLWPYTASAQAQLDAYSVEVAVADRSDEEKQAAYQVAMRRVLLTNSGDKTLLNRDDVRTGLREAVSYVDLFRFRTPAPGTIISQETPVTEAVRLSGEATQLMLVRFDRTRIVELIAGDEAVTATEDAEATGDALVNVSSALVWMLIKDDERDILVAGDEVSNVQQRVREIAGGAGVSLIFPTGDEVDHVALTSDDVRRGDVERIRVASERYARPVILVANLTRNGPRGWSGEWTKLTSMAPADGADDTENTLATSRFESDSLDKSLQQGIGWLSPQAAAVAEAVPAYQYGGGGLSDTEALVWVGSLASTNGYAEVMRFIESIDSVATVYPKEVTDSSMVFAVLPRSAITDVRAATGKTNWLRQTAPPASAVNSQLARNAELALDYLR